MGGEDGNASAGFGNASVAIRTRPRPRAGDALREGDLLVAGRAEGGFLMAPLAVAAWGRWPWSKFDLGARN